MSNPRPILDTTCNVRGANLHAPCAPYRRCRRPDCSTCEWIKAKKIVGTVDALTQNLTSLLSVTLTVPPSTQNLESQIGGLMSAFNSLRRQAPWQRSIVGGIRCLHAPYRQIDQSWHPHVHVLAEGWDTES